MYEKILPHLTFSCIWDNSCLFSIIVYKNFLVLQLMHTRTISFVLPVCQTSCTIFTTCQWSCRKVMFSVMCACQFVCLQGAPCDHYPWCIGPHHTGTPSVQGPCPLCTGFWPPLYRVHSPAGDIWWTRLETCSNLFTWGPTSPRVLKSGDYWNMYSQ